MVKYLWKSVTNIVLVYAQTRTR